MDENSEKERELRVMAMSVGKKVVRGKDRDCFYT